GRSPSPRSSSGLAGPQGMRRRLDSASCRRLGSRPGTTAEVEGCRCSGVRVMRAGSRPDAILDAVTRAPSALGILAILLLGPVVAGAAELYVTNTHSGTISIIDTERDEVIGTIPVGGGVPNRSVLTPDGRHLWVIHDKSRRMTIVDPAARKVLRQIKIGEWPYNLAFSPDGRYCWVL